MSTQMSNFNFNLMSFFMTAFKKKSFIEKRIRESQIKKDDYVLDYACGPGIFTIPIASFIGEQGKVIAADIHPLAGEKICKKASNMELTNIEFYQTDCELPIPDNSINVALLFDCIHMFKNINKILAEIHRVLRNDGVLSVDIHHIKKENGMSLIEKSNLFSLEMNHDNSNHLLYKPRK
ncbi:class I SAM-dependent methyltransferase [Candidatus Lokiarchaeum ossiferum]|uniref:class I SAM-dependent methyltransferase n=1 Tax=Candidatus Lokiarchaeum ossiferum TaxID=2951803 RepID=UPI00352DA33E